MAAAYRRAVGEGRRRGLLLGVTPELADISRDLTAVERSQATINRRWPGDTPNRRAICADWKDVPLPARGFDICVGDGSLNVLSSQAEIAFMLDRLSTLLEPGGQIVIRLYLTPEAGETVDQVFRAASSGEVVSFSAFKFRLAMAMVSERGDPSIRVADIAEAFNRAVSDRMAFSRDTGISRAEIEVIDIYVGSTETYCFTTQSQLVATIPPSLRLVSFIDTGTYELAERCPIAIIEVR